jgi:hypothetical protein
MSVTFSQAICREYKWKPSVVQYVLEVEVKGINEFQFFIQSEIVKIKFRCTHTYTNTNLYI